ncbi:hypothetical protein EYZ11_011043 [Aspergillus tanneri]|uniref:Uncharacterized protein n=1 Tax=Aspergillus tanneri TaxID=1220188 RepID=A0A4S3J3S9_9EURO|nr:hypothetical protein EYZ11_011043 [Aspergillus tanneri]
MTLIGQSTAITKDVLPSKDFPWTPEKQDAFSNTMGQTIDGRGNVTSLALGKLFNGTDKSVKIFGSAISDGKFIEGKREGNPPKSGNAQNELRANIAKSFFGYSIPALWRVSKTYAFIIDSGYGCAEGKKLSDYLDDHTMDATGVVTDGGPCQQVCRDNKFSEPPGLDSLINGNFGGITKDDLVKGSVRTWVQNGKKNGQGQRQR